MKGTIRKNYRGPEILVFVFGDPRPLLLRQVGDGDEASVRVRGDATFMAPWRRDSDGLGCVLGWGGTIDEKEQTTTWDV